MSQKVVSFHYQLTDPQGEMIDSSEGHEPLTFLVGVGQIIPGLEKHILTMAMGDKAGEVKEGMQFQAKGELAGRPLTVIKVTQTHATLDANHPLAGIDLSFNVEITEIREASAQELQHGHAHGPGGHDH